MSRNNLWQICHKNKTGNKLLTDNIVQAIRTHELGSGLVILKERKTGYAWDTSVPPAYSVFLPLLRIIT